MTDRLMQAFSVFLAYFDDSAAIFVGSVGVVIGLLAMSALYLASGALDSQRRRVRLVVNEGSSKANRSGRRLESAVSPIRSIILPTSKKEADYESLSAAVTFEIK